MVECWRAYSDHVGSDVANTSGPALGRLVKDVVNPEAAVLLGEGIEVLLEQDVLGGDVGEDEVHLSLVAGSTAADDGADNLEHGGDSSAASNHTEVTDHVGGVHEGALGALDAESLADLERGHVLGDIASGVGLDQKVKVARLVVARDGGIGAHDLLGGAIGLGQFGANGDVLADGEAEDRIGGGERETVASRGRSAQAQGKATQGGTGRAGGHSHGDIVGDDGLLLELELLEGIGLQDLLELCQLLSV